ncbi:TonB-dependent receptor plug domain-containing protein [Peristeroidobacter soli]|jgi:outer membrane receptor protein involved in Fe transport|uniref:TonB-dependent receptor plug domain-containing protein n=1 Tax=Peristeroidobacter soli TaxID=2497877 RepID=UPI00101CE649|nr:TonB-dependent receptor [Peristeroidobacter soli]
MIVRFSNLVIFSVLGSAAVAPGSALAQQRSQRTADVELEEVVVTGSKLLRPDASAPIPVTSVNSDDIDTSGATMISDYIRELPVFGINSGRVTEVSGADSAKPLATAGTERLNLRDLGVDRTLVVVDGRRHVGSTAGSTAVDVGSIPTALIERVEISTGGASTAYGADAIAGVVNFIMKKNFEGVQIDTRYGDTDEGGGENKYMALTVGSNFADGRGNAVLSASYNSLGGITSNQREWMRKRYAFVGNPADTGPNDGIPAEVLATNGRLTNVVSDLSSVFGLLDGGNLVFDHGTIRPFANGVGAGDFLNVIGGDGIDMSKYLAISTPMERKSMFASLNYQLTEKTTFFFEAKSYLTDTTVLSTPMLDAITYPETGDLFLVYPDNPFLPQSAMLDQLFTDNFGLVTMSRSNGDFPQRYADIHRNLNRFVAGVEGETGFRDWRFEVYGQYGRTSEEYREHNNRDPRRWQLATDPVTDVAGVTGVAPGSPVCRATLNAALAGGPKDPDVVACRPADLFGAGGISRDAYNYFLIDLLTERSVEQMVGAASLNGTVFELPAGPVSFAAGLEYRQEKSETLPDSAQVTGQTYTGATPAVIGKYDVSEAYIESRVPLLKDKPFAELLAIEGGFRTSDYSVTGGANSWRVGAEWAPVRDIRFRGMYAESVRAPNIGELFTPQSGTVAVPDDPCLAAYVHQGPAPDRRLANCTADLARFGLDPNTYALNPGFIGFSYGGIAGGNPKLKEEEGTSLTYGFVYTPRFIPEMTLSLDFYDIEIDGVITSPDPTSVVSGCYDNFDNIDNQYCALITRYPDPSSLGYGAIQTVVLTTRNLARLSTSGVDFQIDYRLMLGPGALSARLIANYVDSYEEKPLADAVLSNELVGGPRNPEIRGGVQLGYNVNHLTLGYQLRYIGGVRFTRVEVANPIETQDPYTVGHETISDVHAAYDFGFAGHRYQFSLGVDNVFNTEPPPGSRTGRFTGGSPYYDPIGRFYYAGLRASF